MKSFFSSLQKASLPNFILKSLFTSYALCNVFHAPLILSHYESTTDFIIASIYELLGSYNFQFFLCFILSFSFYKFASNAKFKDSKSSYLLSLFLGFCLLLGNSYYEIGSWNYCFGSFINFLKFLGSLTGYTFLFYTCIRLLYFFFNENSYQNFQSHFFEKYCFLKTFCILHAVYLPFVILSYPGNLCWDVIGEVEQVLLNTGYSTHHPLVHTLLIGGLVKAGGFFFHSYEVGLFLYTLGQCTFFITALSFTISTLQKRHASFAMLCTLLVLYCITPVYTNMASTPLKDIPFCSFLLLYVVFLANACETPELLKNKKFVILFILIQVGVILFRNNGIYVIFLSGIGCSLYLLFQKKITKILPLCCSLFVGSILIGKILLIFLAESLCATPGSIGEMLSIPFQQTARYLTSYEAELTDSERDAIENILGDTQTIASHYNPNLSDPVKALYKKDATNKDLISYFKVWGKCFFKHPNVYLEAFFAHIYGWFTPSVSNAIRYETDYPLISQDGLFKNANKLLIFYYRFAQRFTPLGILENIGFSVWALFFLGFYQKKQGQLHCLFASLPLWVSLLICMASPCFFQHPRYAFPILFSLPFLYGFTLTTSQNDLKG